MEGLYGPGFKVLHSFRDSRNVDCRICTEDDKSPVMTRGEFWDKKSMVWRQWLQSSEANFMLNAHKDKEAALVERDALKAERDALKTERDELKRRLGE